MGLFAFVLVAGNVVRDVLAPGLLSQISWRELGRFTLLLIPYVAAYSLPMGVLTGVLLTLGRLSAENEITAMRASGLSMARIAVPVLALGLIGAAVAVPTNFVWMPWSALRKERVLTDIVRANPLSEIVPRTFIYNFPGLVVYVGWREGAQIRDVWIWKVDRLKRATAIWHADTGELRYNEPAFEFILTLHGVMAETLDDRAPEEYLQAPPRVAVWESWDPMHLPLAQLLGRPQTRQKLQWMTYPELLHEEARRKAEPLPKGGVAAREREVMQVQLTLSSKFNSILAVFSFAFIGIPLGIKVSRRETSANLGVAVALALGYQFLTVAVTWLEGHPSWRPDRLEWIPNLIFLALGFLLFRRLDKT